MKRFACVILGVSFLFFGGGEPQVSAKVGEELKVDETEISPAAIFAPDRCIIARTVEKFGSGWYVNGMFLDKAAKHGLWNPKVGDNIDIMLDNKNRVVGWKVNN